MIFDATINIRNVLGGNEMKRNFKVADNLIPTIRLINLPAHVTVVLGENGVVKVNRSGLKNFISAKECFGDLHEIVIKQKLPGKNNVLYNVIIPFLNKVFRIKKHFSLTEIVIEVPKLVNLEIENVASLTIKDGIVQGKNLLITMVSKNEADIKANFENNILKCQDESELRLVEGGGNVNLEAKGQSTVYINGDFEKFTSNISDNSDFVVCGKAEKFIGMFNDRCCVDVSNLENKPLCQSMEIDCSSNMVKLTPHFRF